MKFSIFSFLFLSLFIFSSCEKLKSWDDLEKDKNYDKSEWDKENCFELVYPIAYTMPDGSTISGNEESINTAMKDWYETHADSKEKPSLQYPINIVFDEETLSINNEEEMIEVKKDCYDKEKWDKENCFEVVFPISFLMPDDSTISGDEATIKTAIKNWYETNPTVDEKPILQYPIDIIFDEETLSINNEEEMIEIKKDC